MRKVSNLLTTMSSICNFLKKYSKVSAKAAKLKLIKNASLSSDRYEVRKNVWTSKMVCVIQIGLLLCVQMDFMRTFETTTMCNNKNHVWSHFYKIWVVLKYHRRLWANIFDTDISRCINTYIRVVYIFGIFWDIYAPTNVCVKDIGS